MAAEELIQNVEKTSAQNWANSNIEAKHLVWIEVSIWGRIVPFDQYKKEWGDPRTWEELPDTWWLHDEPVKSSLRNRVEKVRPGKRYCTGSTPNDLSWEEID